MGNDRKIEKIIDEYLPSISRGELTIESVLLKYPAVADQLRPRLEVARRLQSSVSNLNPRPGFIPSSRKYIESKIESMEPHGFLKRLLRQHTPQRLIFNFASPILVIFMLVLLANSFFLSARLALPGDTLYPAKLLTEDLRLALTFNRLEKTGLYIQYSRERTTEFVELVLEGSYDTLPSAAARLETEIIDSLRSIDRITENDTAVMHPMIANLRDTLSNEIFMLNVLKDTSPPSAYPGIELAIQAAQSGLMALR